MKVGISDDYAVLYGKGFRIYYGYEETDAEDNWLFTVHKDNKLIMSATAEELGTYQFDQIERILLLGIGKLLEENLTSLE